MRGIDHSDFAGVLQRHQILENYPNPFNSSTTIRYRLTKADNVRLAVYDLSGREIVELVQAYQSADLYRYFWDGRNSHGALVPTGLYFARLERDRAAV
ncbi:MAG TPA: T9SS type A sorting domain-containing protein [Candidatus Marinimicrobia bacterium]|nr:T9SS type A sorting domain-containing protein [Candidatus Neomarinimicrobiota bacterium]